MLKKRMTTMIIIGVILWIGCKIVSQEDNDNIKVRDIYTLRIAEGEITPWLETEYIPCESPEIFMASRLNGYVEMHKQKGLIEGFIQDLAVGGERYATIIAMDFGKESSAAEMYEYQKPQVSNKILVSGVNESNAIIDNSSADGCTAYFFFNRFYFELTMWGYTDKTESIKDAQSIIQHFKSKIYSN